MAPPFPSRVLSFAAPSLLSILLVGCAGHKGRWTQTPLRFEPASPEVAWRGGLGYVACPDSGIDVEAAFEGVRAGHIRFAVKARNALPSPFDLDPRTYRLLHPLPPSDSVDRSSDYVFLDDPGAFDTLSLAALDPGQQLETVRRSLDDLDKAKNPFHSENQSIGGAILVGLLKGITEATTAPKDETPAQARARRAQEDREEEESRREEAQKWNVEHRRSLERYREEEVLWSRSALARTTLGPGESAEGLVVFRMDPRLAKTTWRWMILDTSAAGRKSKALRDSLETANPFLSRLVVPTGATPCQLPFRQVRSPIPEGE